MLVELMLLFLDFEGAACAGAPPAALASGVGAGASALGTCMRPIALAEGLAEKEMLG